MLAPLIYIPAAWGMVRRRRPRENVFLVALATLFPFTLPALAFEATLDFRSEADHRQLQANLAEWSRRVRTGSGAIYNRLVVKPLRESVLISRRFMGKSLEVGVQI
jgi:hypothetical protein